MKKIIITGATGFLGRNLIQAFNKQETLIYAVVHSESSVVNVLKSENVIPIVCNNKEIETLHEKIKEKDIDLFFHLAWDGVSTTYKNDLEHQLKNIKISVEYFKQAKLMNVSKFITTGSASEYAYCNEPINGTLFPKPSDMYSASKVCVRVILQILSIQLNLESIYILIPSIYGPGRNDNNLVTYAIKKFLKGEKPSFTKLEQIWNYVYIDDVIRALILIGEKGKGQKVYPVGNKKELKLSEYVDIIRNNINPNLPLGVGELEYKTSSIDNCILDCSETEKDTGFVSEITFEQGIIKTIDYFRKEMGEISGE